MAGERRVAIVTGSDSGIGKATAVELARAGHDVGIAWTSDGGASGRPPELDLLPDGRRCHHLVHTDREGAEGTAAEVRALGGRAELRQVDLARLPEAAEVVDDLAGALGALHVLVNDAGTGASTPFLDHGFDELRHVLTVDLEAPFLLSQRAARLMVDTGVRGSIVNVTSVHEHIPLPGSAAYCAAQGGLGLLTKVMALELAEHGIRVNAIAPGEIATPMTGQHDVDAAAQDRPRIPFGRPGDAHEIATAIVFLASDAAAYVTGASLVADGGLMLMAAVP
jgi:NAD(P)-dependent dehydrogenase (short-subunit alcohol dehydrogenase family)